MDPKSTRKKEPSPLRQKAVRAWKRGKGWVTMPSRSRKPLTEAQIRRAFYEQAFDLQDLLSIIRRLIREGDTRNVKRLENEAIQMGKELSNEMNTHAVTRALRAQRVFDSSIKQRVRYAMHRINTNPGRAEIVEQNRRIAKILGKKYEPFARDYHQMVDVLEAQVRLLAVRKRGPTHTVFAAQPSPFARVQKLFRRKRSKPSG